MTVHTKEHLREAESVRNKDQQLSNSCECLGIAVLMTFTCVKALFMLNNK